MDKQKLWVTLCVPVEVEDEGNGIPIAQTALDTAWELLMDINEPPEGLLEFVTPHEPHIPVNLLEPASETGPQAIAV